MGVALALDWKVADHDDGYRVHMGDASHGSRQPPGPVYADPPRIEDRRVPPAQNAWGRWQPTDPTFDERWWLVDAVRGVWCEHSGHPDERGHSGSGTVGVVDVGGYLRTVEVGPRAARAFLVVGDAA